MCTFILYSVPIHAAYAPDTAQIIFSLRHGILRFRCPGYFGSFGSFACFSGKLERITAQKMTAQPSS